ncbi:MAG: SGNH/GDSL hydrolase family protein [Corynebacterium variabile]|uniref:SGNH/GDSL hydrolase family protein n=1 Tax=Corynebacterium variabile TaxID=1727 RepID=UPI003F9ABACC
MSRMTTGWAKAATATIAIGTLALAGCTSSDDSTTSESTSPSTSASPTGGVITEGVFFGNSLTDAGTYGYRFTTMPGQTWAQHIAAGLGQSTESNEHVPDPNYVYVGKPGEPGPGGLNYAEGGAKANSAYSGVSDAADGTPISVKVQVDRFLEQHEKFEPDQLATVYVGTNDVAYNYDPSINPEMAQSLRDNTPVSKSVMSSEDARVRTAASDEADQVQRMLDNGAEHILVFKVFDLAKLPWFESDASRDYVHTLATSYNDELEKSLPEDPASRCWTPGPSWTIWWRTMRTTASPTAPTRTPAANRVRMSARRTPGPAKTRTRRTSSALPST